MGTLKWKRLNRQALSILLLFEVLLVLRHFCSESPITCCWAVSSSQCFPGTKFLILRSTSLWNFFHALIQMWWKHQGTCKFLTGRILSFYSHLVAIATEAQLQVFRGMDSASKKKVPVGGKVLKQSHGLDVNPNLRMEPTDSTQCMFNVLYLWVLLEPKASQ